MRAGTAILFLAFGIATATGGAVRLAGETARPATALPTTLRPVESFAAISDPRARSVALFREAGKVLQHPRCTNCHPVGDRPFQGDRQRPHVPRVVRDPNGIGAPGATCGTCHGAANFDPAGSPGDPHWSMPATKMGWKGRSIAQICAQLKDPSQTGGKDLAGILKHVRDDSLIRWAWKPGRGRTPAPGTHDRFVALVAAWIETGAYCPS